MRGRLILAIGAAMLLAGPAMAQPTVGPADPAAVVAELYKTPAPDPDPSIDDPPEAEGPELYAAGLRALLALDAGRDMNYLDFDWVSGGQDLPEYRDLKIVVLGKTTDTARVRVTFRNFGEARERLIDMVVEDGRWVIEDVYMKAPEKDWLSRRLVANPQD
ncbi:MAG: hypothetical protein EON95_13950 [Caulobacteraceae bacterium]|nr:MAG: hypothetical protein EON95_13950 [Caulobacteraceae bacterium]